MRLYETTFITDSQLSESEIETEIKKVEELITANGGEIVETQRWGVRRFAYEIGHKRQGYYAHFLHKSATSIPAAIEAAFKVNERIIRFLTVLSNVDLEARQKEEAAVTVVAVAPVVEIVIPPVEQPVITDLDEPEEVEPL